MRKFLLTILALIGLMFALGSCSSDDSNDNFDYPLEILYGTWRITHVEQTNGIMLDVTTTVAEQVFKPTYAKFNPDGTYSGSGYFGYGTGTYQAKGKTIVCYIEEEEYMRYDVLSLSGAECELQMYKEGSLSPIKIRCKKQ